MATDLVVDVSDRATDSLLVLFNTRCRPRVPASAAGVPEAGLEALGSFGLSSICNVLAAIKVARQQQLGPRRRAPHGRHRRRRDVRLRGASGSSPATSPAAFDAVAAGETFGRPTSTPIDTTDMLECRREDRERIFNLGYYTWVEQQGVPLDEFEARRSQAFWTETRGDRAPTGTR